MNIGKMAEWDLDGQLEDGPDQVRIDQVLEFYKDQLPCGSFGQATPDKKSRKKEEERHSETKEDHIGGYHCLWHDDAAELDAADHMTIHYQQDGDALEVVYPGQAAFLKQGGIKRLRQPVLYVRAIPFHQPAIN